MNPGVAPSTRCGRDGGTTTASSPKPMFSSLFFSMRFLQGKHTTRLSSAAPMMRSRQHALVHATHNVGFRFFTALAVLPKRTDALDVVLGEHSEASCDEPTERKLTAHHAVQHCAQEHRTHTCISTLHSPLWSSGKLPLTVTPTHVVNTGSCPLLGTRIQTAAHTQRPGHNTTLNARYELGGVGFGDRGVFIATHGDHFQV